MEPYKKPQVSIGMPVYNGENTIHEALTSILNQSFTDFELIVSDNASTDRTEEICREYAAKDSRIQFVRQPVNLGWRANFKFVLDKAVGKYFMWSAADDSQEQNFIETLVNMLKENQSLVCVMSDVINNWDTIDEGDSVSSLDNIRLGNVEKNWPKCRRQFFRNPTSNIYFCIYGLFRTDIIKSVDISYRNIHKYDFSSEIPLLAQVAVIGKIASISIPLKIYRRHSESTYYLEQFAINHWDRLLGFSTVSLSLILIAMRSDTTILHKLGNMGTTAMTSFKWTVRFFMHLIYDSVRKVFVSM